MAGQREGAEVNDGRTASVVGRKAYRGRQDGGQLERYQQVRQKLLQICLEDLNLC